MAFWKDLLPHTATLSFLKKVRSVWTCFSPKCCQHFWHTSYPPAKSENGMQVPLKILLLVKPEMEYFTVAFTLIFTFLSLDTVLHTVYCCVFVVQHSWVLYFTILFGNIALNLRKCFLFSFFLCVENVNYKKVQHRKLRYLDAMLLGGVYKTANPGTPFFAHDYLYCKNGNEEDCKC